MIFNEEVFFDGKPIKITTELMTALNEAVDLAEIQPASDFEDIQLEEDEEFSTNVIEDFIDIDGPENNIKDDGLSIKLLDKSFYLILPSSVYDYLNHIDFFIPIRSKRMGKRAIIVITAIPITAGTLLAATTGITATPGTRSD